MAHRVLGVSINKHHYIGLLSCIREVTGGVWDAWRVHTGVGQGCNPKGKGAFWLVSVAPFHFTPGTTSKGFTPLSKGLPNDH